jgi:flagellar hook-basal body protein
MLMHLQEQGELQRTDRPLDLAVDGEGLLLVKDKSGALGGARTGTFHVTKEGLIQDAQGLTLQGWPLLPEGTAGSSSAKAAATQAVQSAPPPSSATAVGSLGDLEDVHLLLPPGEVSASTAKASHPHESRFRETGLTIQKQDDGLYSLCNSEIQVNGFYESTYAQHTFVDSLGSERVVDIKVQKLPHPSPSTSFFLQSSGLDAELVLRADGVLQCEAGCTFDNTTKQVTVTFPDTGAELTLDISNVQMPMGSCSPPTSEGVFSWDFPPMILEKGTYLVEHMLILDHHDVWGISGMALLVKKNEDGSFGGTLYEGDVRIDLHFDDHGWVSSYKFTHNGNNESVGIEQTGEIIKGVNFGNGATTIDIDLSAFRLINRTGSNLVVNGNTIKPVDSSGEDETAGAVSGDALSGSSLTAVPPPPSSLSIDENGVLSRLKDNGDWEPLYLLTCCQFAAMNAAEERNGVYYATPASGVLRTGVSGQEGMGTITAGTLERSTTDLAHELSEMIKAQHAYAANTKVLSTIDDMLTELERL